MNTAPARQWPETDDYDEFTAWADFSFAGVICIASLVIGSAAGALVWTFLNLAR